MPIRETINRRPILFGVVMIVATAIATMVSIRQLRSRRQGPPDKAFFTVDEGKTYFADDSMLVAPVDHNGQEAVQCYVFRCGKKDFVGYLLKYSPQGKDQLEQQHAAGLASAVGLSGSEVLVKKPGDKSWVDQGNDKSRSILQIHCPDDPNAGVEVVAP